MGGKKSGYAGGSSLLCLTARHFLRLNFFSLVGYFRRLYSTWSFVPSVITVSNAITQLLTFAVPNGPVFDLCAKLLPYVLLYKKSFFELSLSILHFSSSTEPTGIMKLCLT